LHFEIKGRPVIPASMKGKKRMPQGMATKEVHLYHATLPPKIVYGEPAVREAMFDKDGNPTGYGLEYIPQEFPKHVHQVAGNEDEQKVMLADGWHFDPETLSGPFPRTGTKVDLGPKMVKKEVL